MGMTLRRHGSDIKEAWEWHYGKDNDGCTLLHWIVELGHNVAILLLLV